MAVPAFSKEPPHPTTLRAKPPDTKTQIVTDEKTHTMRVLVDGKEVLTIDSEGLHVHGDLDYTGVLTDGGKPHP